MIPEIVVLPLPTPSLWRPYSKAGCPGPQANAWSPSTVFIFLSDSPRLSALKWFTRLSAQSDSHFPLCFMPFPFPLLLPLRLHLTLLYIVTLTHPKWRTSLYLTCVCAPVYVSIHTHVRLARVETEQTSESLLLWGHGCPCGSGSWIKNHAKSHFPYFRGTSLPTQVPTPSLLCSSRML